jgi:hypothetical protein
VRPFVPTSTRRNGDINGRVSNNYYRQTREGSQNSQRRPVGITFKPSSVAPSNDILRRMESLMRQRQDRIIGNIGRMQESNNNLIFSTNRVINNGGSFNEASQNQNGRININQNIEDFIEQMNNIVP